MKIPSGAFGVCGSSGAHGLLRPAPLATNCWLETPWGGGGIVRGLGPGDPPPPPVGHFGLKSCPGQAWRAAAPYNTTLKCSYAKPLVGVWCFSGLGLNSDRAIEVTTATQGFGVAIALMQNMLPMNGMPRAEQPAMARVQRVPWGRLLARRPQGVFNHFRVCRRGGGPPPPHFLRCPVRWAPQHTYLKIIPMTR